MKKEKSIRLAEFNETVCRYWLLSGAVAMTCSIVGIPFLLLWFPLGLIFTKRYLGRMSCELTTSSLKVSKGILVRTEKTIPLEKITDMGMVQGPIMRKFGLHTLTVETAGQSGTGALVSLTGIRNAPEFRQMVLDQRDASSGKTSNETSESSESMLDVLKDIRDILSRIEKKDF